MMERSDVSRIAPAPHGPASSSLVFAVVYLGMVLGRLPGLAIDRTGVALLGAIALVGIGAARRRDAAWAAIDVPTIALLFGLMVVSAQFRLGGFYAARHARASPRATLSPPALLAARGRRRGLLSAVLANDIVCLAMAPVLVEGCARRGLDPVPFLLGARLRRQRRLGGDADRQPAEHADRPGAAPVVRRLPARRGRAGRCSGCVATWAIVAWRTGGAGRASARVRRPIAGRRSTAWQTTRGSVVLARADGGFLFTAVAARASSRSAAAGVLLAQPPHGARARCSAWSTGTCWCCSSGLFVVNHALAPRGTAGRGRSAASATPASTWPSPAWLFVRHRGAVEPGLQRAGGDAAAAGRHPPAGRADPRARQHARRQPVPGRQHRQPDRGRPGGRGSACASAGASTPASASR